jgi:hypothetical protein
MVDPLSMFQVVQDNKEDEQGAAPSPTPNYGMMKHIRLQSRQKKDIRSRPRINSRAESD